MEEELSVTKESLQNANHRILLKDSIITKFQLQTNNYNLLIDNYNQTIGKMENLTSNLKKEVSLQNKIIRRQKLSKWIVGGLGLTIGILISK